MSRILVTGGAGFIGRHLVERLAERGHDVRCLVRRPDACPPELARRAELWPGDLTAPASLAAAVKNVSLVYHVAGRTSARHARDLFAVNAQGTAALLEACARQTSPPLVVYVSSLAAVGPSRANCPRSEGDHPAPVSHYGRSKLAAEQAVHTWAGRVPATIVRPGIVFGPRDRNTLPLFQTVAYTGMHAIAGARLSRYSFIHVHDLIHLLQLAAERGTRVSETSPAGGRYFAVAREQPHGLELSCMLAHAVNVHPHLPLFIPEPAVWILALVNEGISLAMGQPPLIGIDKVREATAGNWTASMAAAERDLGFAPAAPLAQQFAETAAWYREAGWLKSWSSALAFASRIGIRKRQSTTTSAPSAVPHRAESHSH